MEDRYAKVNQMVGNNSCNRVYSIKGKGLHMTTRDLSKAHETAVAKALHGIRTPNSGATSFTKGDVIVGDVLIECKTKMTEVTAFSIQKEWLVTLEEERRGMGKSVCALAYSYNSGKDSYYIIDERTMKMLLEYVQYAQEGNK